MWIFGRRTFQEEYRGVSRGPGAGRTMPEVSRNTRKPEWLELNDGRIQIM